MKFTEKTGGYSTKRQAEISFTATKEEKEEIWNTASHSTNKSVLVTGALMLLKLVGNNELTEIEELDLPCTQNDRAIFDEIFDSGQLYLSYSKEWRVQEDGTSHVQFNIKVMADEFKQDGGDPSYVLFELKSNAFNETRYATSSGTLTVSTGLYKPKKK